MNLFDEGGKYTSEAIKLDVIVRAALEPIFKRGRENGYSFRDISHITMLASTSVESMLVMEEAVRNRKKVLKV